jgi:hypothetical protein
LIYASILYGGHFRAIWTWTPEFTRQIEVDGSGGTLNTIPDVCEEAGETGGARGGGQEQGARRVHIDKQAQPPCAATTVAFFVVFLQRQKQNKKIPGVIGLQKYTNSNYSPHCP